MGFKEISPREIKGNAIGMIAEEWMLICAGNQEKHNMMTASWGFLGEMWGKDCAVCAIRPTRFTYGMVDNGDTFALCFMGENKAVHKICGSKSGRDTDKVSECNLKPVFEDGTMYFEEARLVLICKKLYSQNLEPECFCDKSADEKWYSNDYHKMFYGEIVKALVKE